MWAALACYMAASISAGAGQLRMVSRPKSGGWKTGCLGKGLNLGQLVSAPVACRLPAG